MFKQFHTLKMCYFINKLIINNFKNSTLIIDL
jgi:hypothetical protein